MSELDDFFIWKKFMKKEIIVLEDIWWDEIIWNLWMLNPDFEMLVETNIFNPLDYLDLIIEKADNCLILLDNYFPTTSYPEALWARLLEKLLETKKDFQIICISDYWKSLISEYDAWKKADEKWWILDRCIHKDAFEIYDSFKKLNLLKDL